MEEYTYSYISDPDDEIIGRVQATSLFEAREKVAFIKQLNIELINHLFKIKKTNDHGKPNSKNTR